MYLHKLRTVVTAPIQLLDELMEQHRILASPQIY